MVTTTDIEYQNAKLIKQGKKKISPEFKELADWISNKYKVNIINICHELMDSQNRIRIGIAVETYDEYLKFKEDDERWSNYDEKIQNDIAEKYIELNNQVLRIKSEEKVLGLINKHKKLIPNDIFVAPSAFEPIAMEDANTQIPEIKVKQIISNYDSSNIWMISKLFRTATLFVYYQEQKSDLENSTDFKKIENDYFDLLKEYDEFNYWKRKDFNLGIDTKQNFDENYEGNWYYYYK